MFFLIAIQDWHYGGLSTTQKHTTKYQKTFMSITPAPLNT